MATGGRTCRDNRSLAAEVGNARLDKHKSLSLFPRSGEGGGEEGGGRQRAESPFLIVCPSSIKLSAHKWIKIVFLRERQRRRPVD